jgi:enoyl-CoA hydratase
MNNRRLNNILSQFAPNVTASSIGILANNTSAKLPSLQFVKFEVQDRVGICTLNRPNELNAINDALIRDLVSAIEYCNIESSNIGCIVITGAGKAFAAGADIKEMKDKSYFEMSTHDKILPWEGIAKSKVPIIAAVNGFALGGGCEIAMMCDIIYASESAVFGQPEIKLGTIPGAGGTQRLTRAIGKAKAMEMVLTGRMIKATEAEKAGLVAAVYPADQLVANAIKTAKEISVLSKPVVKLAKESVNAAFETTLNEGNHLERRLFHSTFALKDQKIGMNAFANKSAPKFEHQ